MVFVFACIAFVCAREPVIAGDGVRYGTRVHCQRAAEAYARRNRIRLNVREISCTERDEEK